MTKSKISTVSFVRERAGKQGPMFEFQLTLENGDHGKFNTATKAGPNVGDELEYSIIDNGYGPVLKENKPKQEFKGKSNYTPRDFKKEFISFAASYVKDEIVGGKVDIKDFEKEADRIFNRMSSKLEAIVPAQSSGGGEAKISEAQVGFAQSLRAKTKLTEDQRLTYLQKKYKVDSSKDLTKSQASEYINDLQKPDFNVIYLGSLSQEGQGVSK